MAAAHRTLSVATMLYGSPSKLEAGPVHATRVRPRTLRATRAVTAAAGHATPDHPLFQAMLPARHFLFWTHDADPDTRNDQRI